MALRVVGRCSSRSPSKSLPAQTRRFSNKNTYSIEIKNKSLPEHTSAIFARYIHTNAHTLHESKSIEKGMPPLKWNKELGEKARKLVFGSKTYKEFTEEEKKVVDFYQAKLLEVDGGVVLPNTRAELEQQELNALLRQAQTRNKKSIYRLKNQQV